MNEGDAHVAFQARSEVHTHTGSELVVLCGNKTKISVCNGSDPLFKKKLSVPLGGWAAALLSHICTSQNASQPH